MKKVFNYSSLMAFIFFLIMTLPGVILILCGLPLAVSPNWLLSIGCLGLIKGKIGRIVYGGYNMHKNNMIGIPIIILSILLGYVQIRRQLILYKFDGTFDRFDFLANNYIDVVIIGIIQTIVLYIILAIREYIKVIKGGIIIDDVEKTIDVNDKRGTETSGVCETDLNKTDLNNKRNACVLNDSLEDIHMQISDPVIGSFNENNVIEKSVNFSSRFKHIFFKSKKYEILCYVVGILSVIGLYLYYTNNKTDETKTDSCYSTILGQYLYVDLENAIHTRRDCRMLMSAKIKRISPKDIEESMLKVTCTECIDDISYNTLCQIIRDRKSDERVALLIELFKELDITEFPLNAVALKSWIKEDETRYNIIWNTLKGHKVNRIGRTSDDFKEWVIGNENKIKPQTIANTRKYVYDILVEKGYNLGTYKKYLELLNLEEDRKWLHEKLNLHFSDVPSYEEFVKSLGY